VSVWNLPKPRSPEVKEKKWCGMMTSPGVMWTLPRHATCHHFDDDNCIKWTPEDKEVLELSVWKKLNVQV
jgi:hypothetical protein